jgi:hypothetical protein
MNVRDNRMVELKQYLPSHMTLMVPYERNCLNIHTASCHAGNITAMRRPYIIPILSRLRLEN